MSYEINVSLNGKHFFATAERSIKDKTDLNRVFPVLAARFPKAEGFRLTVSYSRKESHYVDPETGKVPNVPDVWKQDARDISEIERLTEYVESCAYRVIPKAG